MSLEENLRNKTLFLVRIQVMYEDISNNSIIYITQLFYLITFLILKYLRLNLILLYVLIFFRIFIMMIYLKINHGM